MRIFTYFRVAAIALLVFDYLLTFPQEVSLIWPSRWTLIKVLFLLTRYMPFVEAGMGAYEHFLRHPTAEICYLFFKTTSWLLLVGMILTEIMLTLRTWAVWNRDQRLSIGLPIFFLLCFVPAVKVIDISIKSLSFMPLQSPVLLGCLMIKGSSLVGVPWFLLLVYEAGIFLLMLLKAMQFYKIGGRSQMFNIVFGNGLLFYMYLFIITLINLIFSQTLPPLLKLTLVTITRMFHAILGCRVVLDIKAEASNSGLVAIGPSPASGVSESETFPSSTQT